MDDTLLITSSILDALHWIKICPPSWKKKARLDLISTLRREEYIETPETRRGIDFENLVEDICHGRSTEKLIPPVTMSVVRTCDGGAFQAKVKTIKNIGGYNVVLYSKVDVLFTHKIVDIKTTGSWRGRQKYLDGWQHVLYTYVTGVKNFLYKVVVFDKDRPVVGYEVEYEAKPNAEEVIEQGVLELFDWLKAEGLWEDYKNIYSVPEWKRNKK